MNDSWGYKAYDDNWKSAETLVHNLVDVVAKGGNYLLNVGPTAEGMIPPESVERLAELGAWMDVNGDAIYATRPWEHYADGETVRYTFTGGDRVYAISLGWPGDELVLTKVTPRPGSDIHLLGYDAPLSWSTDASGDVTISLPRELQRAEERPVKYAFVFEIMLPSDREAA
jgi:alpha-L-fucosidase